MTYHLSNNLFVNWRSHENRWFLDWFSFSADSGLLRMFFSIKRPTACAIFERLHDEARLLLRPALARVLFEIKDTVDKNTAMTGGEETLLRIAVRIGSRAEGMLELAKRALECISPTMGVAAPVNSFGPLQQSLPYLARVAAARRDMAMLSLLLGAATHLDGDAEFTDGEIRLLTRVMRQLHNWSTDKIEDDIIIYDYIELLIRGGILSTSLSARCCYDDRPKVRIRHPWALTVDEIIMLCPPANRKYLYSAISCYGDKPSLVPTISGIFTAAVEGAHSLQAYLHSCRQDGILDLQAIMQECLLFSASLNDTMTASALIQLGVDPKVSLLSNNRQLYHKGMLSWNPMIAAAVAGNLEMLNVLKEGTDLAAFVESAPVYELVHGLDVPEHEIKEGTELRRLEYLQQNYLGNHAEQSESSVLNGSIYSIDGCLIQVAGPTCTTFNVEKERRIGTLAWIRDISLSLGTSQRFDQDVIRAAVSSTTDVRSGQCRNTAYHPCDVLLLDGLVDANLDYHEGDMDLLQLSIHAQCNLRVVEFLLSKGLHVHSRPALQTGHTMLHDALLSPAQDRSQIVRLLILQGADYILENCEKGLTVLEASLEPQGLDPVRAPGRLSPNLDLFTYLFAAGAPVKRTRCQHIQEWNPLISRLIFELAEDDLIFRVLDAGADLNGRGRNRNLGRRSWTPLEAAITMGREGLARELIKRGADIHTPATFTYTHTALQAACSRGCSLQFIEYLVKEKDANVNEAPANIEGKTALQLAAMSGSLSVAEMLLAHGGDVNALSGEVKHPSLCRGPWTKGKPLRPRALDFAVMYRRLDMVEFLLKAGGRSGTAGLGGAIAIAKDRRCSAILSILLKSEQEHGRMIMKQEAEWQEQNPDLGRILLEPESGDEVLDDSASQSGGRPGTNLDE